MLINTAITGFLILAFGGIYLASAQQVQSSNDKEGDKVVKIDTLNLNKIMVEMETALKLTTGQKPKVAAEVKKYLITRMRYAPAKYKEPEEWMAGSNNKLFDFSQNLEKILDEDQTDCFWAMKPVNKDDNIWWNIFVVY